MTYEEKIDIVCKNYTESFLKENRKAIDAVVKRAFKEGFMLGIKKSKPGQKKGRWQLDTSGYGFWICSDCGFVSEASGADLLYNYCPHCGANMKKGDALYSPKCEADMIGEQDG